MRVAPLAFFLDPHNESDRRTIRDVCRITHRNDEAYLGGLAIIYSIKHGKLERPLIEFLIQKLPDSRVRDRFIEIRNDDLSSCDLASRYPPTGYVVDSVPLSILVATESSCVLNSIESIVKFGGDTDTVASIYGNIYGAVNGTDGLPMQTVQKIDEVSLISQIAADLSLVANAR